MKETIHLLTQFHCSILKKASKHVENKFLLYFFLLITVRFSKQYSLCVEVIGCVCQRKGRGKSWSGKSKGKFYFGILKALEALFINDNNNKKFDFI